MVGSGDDGERRARAFEADFPARWRRFAEDYSRPGEDAVWLISHAGYCFRTGGCRWALDPVVGAGVLAACTPDMARMLPPLTFALVTHMHADHWNPRFAAMLRRPERFWAMPSFVPDDKKARLEASLGRVRWVAPGDRFETDGALVEVLPGAHIKPDGEGPQSVRYRVRTGGGSILFLGDTRDYDLSTLPASANADMLIVHVWYGKGNALRPPYAPYAADFCRYLRATGCSDILLSHLYDFTRTPDERWNSGHARMAVDTICASAPGVRVRVAIAGDCVPLWTERAKT